MRGGWEGGGFGEGKQCCNISVSTNNYFAFLFVQPTANLRGTIILLESRVEQCYAQHGR